MLRQPRMNQLSNLHVELIFSWPTQHIKKQRHYFANKGPSNQGYGFSSGHVWMWELDYKESWAPKNWCFWTVVLEKTLESPLDCKEIQPVPPKELTHWKRLIDRRILYRSVQPVHSLSCLPLCDPMDCSTPGFPVHHQVPEPAQTHVHWVGDATCGLYHWSHLYLGLHIVLPFLIHE